MLQWSELRWAPLHHRGSQAWFSTPALLPVSCVILGLLFKFLTLFPYLVDEDSMSDITILFLKEKNQMRELLGAHLCLSFQLELGFQCLFEAFLSCTPTSSLTLITPVPPSWQGCYPIIIHCLLTRSTEDRNPDSVIKTGYYLNRIYGT